MDTETKFQIQCFLFERGFGNGAVFSNRHTSNQDRELCFVSTTRMEVDVVVPAVLEFMVISPALTPECWNCGRECLDLVGIATGKSEFGVRF